MKKPFIFIVLFLFSVVLLTAGYSVSAEEDSGNSDTENKFSLGENPSSSSGMDTRVLFEDDFLTDDYIDGLNTTAEVDLEKGEIRLPKVYGSETFDATEDGILVLNGNQVEFYLRQSNGSFQQSIEYTDEQVLAVAFSGQGFSHYALKGDGTVMKMEYGSGDFIENPVVKISGLRSATSISASQDAVYIGDSNQILVYEESAWGIHTVDKIDVGARLTNVSSGPSREIVASTAEGIHVLRLSESGYVKSPLEKLSGVASGDINELGWIAGVKDDVVRVKLEANGGVLSFNHAGALAVKFANNSLFVRDNSSITEYAYDGSNLVKVGKITGLEVAEDRYLSPRQYQSMVIEFSNRKPIKKFGIVAQTDEPEPTKIILEVSPDGVLFYPVEGGICELPEETNQLIIRATLTNEEQKNLTPILKKISLYDRSLGIELVETTRIVRDPGGNPPLPTSDAVNIWGGYNFDMRIVATGAVEVEILFSNGEKINATMVDEQTFIATHHFPEDAKGSISVTVKARDEDENEISIDLPDHYILVDNILNNYKVYHVK